MKCQILFPRENKKSKPKGRLLKLLPSMLSVKLVNVTSALHLPRGQYHSPWLSGHSDGTYLVPSSLSGCNTSLAVILPLHFFREI